MIQRGTIAFNCLVCAEYQNPNSKNQASICHLESRNRSSNRRWIRVTGGDSSMESGDWRPQLQLDSRQRIVNRIVDTLKSHIPISGDEVLQELEKIASSFEEKVYIAATSQSDYTRKICFKILTIETRSQNFLPDANRVNPSDLVSTAHMDNADGGDWQEEVYLKIKAMKDLYLLDLNEMHQKILRKLQLHDSHPQQLNNEQFEKLKVVKNMLERFMAFLQIPKHNILPTYMDKLCTYEGQILRVISLNRRKPAPNQ